MRPARTTKKSTTTAKPASTASQQGRRDGAGGGVVSKNSKEQYIKRLQMCMKTYDYKDEQKDVKGKVSRLVK